jgi:diadenosine tetraphosphatase ApaH/serine/threonine PP2A family protein phosphatase
MRIALISDIHANIEALSQALDAIEKKKVDEIICLGDLVGYGASPNECVDLVRRSTSHILLGNHDQAAVDLRVADGFNQYARIAAVWTSRQLSDDHKQFIRDLPYTLVFEDLLFVHSSPFEPKEWHYILSPADAHMSFSYFTDPICFIGHTHVPGIFCEDIWTRTVERGKRFIVNVGSIGQPRDNDPRLSFGIFDSSEWKYENVRLAYDVQKASEKIKLAGLPKPLADRLGQGR